MSDLTAATQQQSRGIVPDGSSGGLHVNRGGQLEVNAIGGLVDSWIRQGRVFETHAATEGGLTTIEANATFDLTEPFFRLTVPSTMVFVPIYITVVTSAVWTTGDLIMLWASDTDTYNTGGLACNTPMSLFLDNQGTGTPRSSGVTSLYDGDSVLTESAVTNIRILDQFGWVTGNLWAPYVWSIFNRPPVYIHGPASFGMVEKGATQEVLYSVIWAELDKNSLVNN